MSTGRRRGVIGRLWRRRAMTAARLGPLLFIASLLLMASSTARAQDSDIRDPLVIKQYWQLAQCAVQNEPDQMAQLLQDFDWGRAKVAAILKVASTQDFCGVPGKWDMRMDATMMRGVIAAEVFLTKRKDHALPDYSTVPVRDRILSMRGKRFLDLRQVMERSSRLRFFGFGECVFHGMPEVVRDLLSTEPATVQENQKMKELGPTMSYCLRNGIGGEVKMSRMLVRASLGEGAYSVDREFEALRLSGTP